MTLSAALNDAGIKLSSYGVGNWKSTCPRCSHARKKKRDPCLSITIAEDHALLFCHNCQWSDRVNDPDSRPQGRPRERQRQDRGDGPPKDPYRPSAAPAAPKRPSFTPGGLPKAGLEWFARRGISQPTLERNQVTVRKVWFPQTKDERTAFCFPFLRDGEVVNVKYRGRSDQGDKIFRQEKDAEKVFYGLDNLPDDYDDLIICEGEIDVLSLNTLGMWNVLSVPDGAPAKPLQDDTADDPDRDTKFAYLWNCRETLDRAKRIILAVDGDGPGRALEYELARRIGRAKCWRVRWPELLGDVQTKDANDVLVNAGADALRETIEAAEPLPIRSLYDLNAFRDDTTALYRGEIKQGVSTGWKMLDPLLRVRPGDLSVITGWPSSGKTTWIDALCLNLARDHGWSFGVASFENPPEEHIANLAHSYIGAPFYDGPSSRMTEDELSSAIDWLRQHFISSEPMTSRRRSIG